MFNKSEIMKRAWEIRNNHNVSMSIAMKSAWSIVKTLRETEEHMEDYCGHAKVKENIWVKGNKARAYISIRYYTNAWNLKREKSFGYIDLYTGERIK